MTPTKKTQKKEKKHYSGHRKRLRNRFMSTNALGFEDYELLELILYRSIPRVDTKPIAKQLLEEFGSLFDVFSADPFLLDEIKGCGPSVIADLKLIYKIHEKLCESHVNKRIVFQNVDKLKAYLVASLSHLPIEEFRILYLDKRHGLIKEEIHQHGTVDQTAVYPREILKRAIQLSASALVLVHNHPSGNPEPSIDDIKTTSLLKERAQLFDIQVIEHFIVGREGCTSFKELDLLFTNQDE